MGREAQCDYRWGDARGHGKTLLEPGELILRGDIRRRVPLSSVRELCVDGEELTFEVGKEKVALRVGAANAARWALAMTRQPPTLAAKLSIRADSRVRVLGQPGGDELRAALDGAAYVGDETPDFIVACVQTAADLKDVIALYLSEGEEVPLWVVHPKGAASPVGGMLVRDMLRKLGYRDTKVCSVSTTESALRFNRSPQKAHIGD